MTYDMKAETVTITGHGDDEIEAYLAQPLGSGPYGGVVVIHHMPGYDEGTKEITRRSPLGATSPLCPTFTRREAPGALRTTPPPPPGRSEGCRTSAWSVTFKALPTF